MRDDDTTLYQLKEEVAKFRDERDWSQFHNAKNLSMAIAVEAGELMEHLMWKNEQEVESYLQKEEEKKEVVHELADTVIACLLLADELEINLAQAISTKLAKNKEKYPPELARGKAKKYTEYQE